MRRTLVRGLIALGAGIAAMVFLIATTSRPKMSKVVVVTQPVSAGSVISSSDLGALVVESVPPGAVTDPGQVVGRYSETALFPGETLSSAAVGRTYGLGAGLVGVTLPVSPAESGLVFVGDWVDVIGEEGNPTAGSVASVSPLVSHVKVTGVYTSSGAAVTPQALSSSSSSSTAPALVSLAVTPDQAELLASYAGENGDSIWLVYDPSNVGFTTMSTSTGPQPSGSTSSSGSTPGQGQPATPGGAGR